MRVAIIGAGISGLGAAWALAKTAEVTLFEKADYIGGHSHTVEVPIAGGGVIAVDTGFIVYNETTYPNLTRLFQTLKVPTEASDMSFAVSLDDGKLEYASTGLGGLFAQPINLIRPSFLALLRDVLRFYEDANRWLAEGGESTTTLGAFLERGNYGAALSSDHVYPMAAAVWSSSAAEVAAMPMLTFTRFCSNHRLLQRADRLAWRTVTGGSRAYVRRITAALGRSVEIANGAFQVTRDPEGATVIDARGEARRFDQVILACHGDQALRLLGDVSTAERAALGSFQYRANHVVLHKDESFMPRRRRAWASWNYLGKSGRMSRLDDSPPAVTYWMNRLQNLDARYPLFVTLNPETEPAASSVIGRFDYDHPCIDGRAIAGQGLIADLQGRRRTWFAGAHLGYGFHEDGLASGLSVALALGARLPFPTALVPAGRDATKAAA